MPLDIPFARARLAANAKAIAALVEAVGPEQAVWKPNPSDWSILETVCHLADEERLDFRARLELCLRDPALPWPPIDPSGWVSERAYNQRELAAAFADFQAEREQSLAWLAGLQAPDWRRTAVRPRVSLSAGDLMVSWLAHDLLHLRQLVELQRAWLAREADPFDIGYAGDW